MSTICKSFMPWRAWFGNYGACLSCLLVFSVLDAEAASKPSTVQSNNAVDNVTLVVPPVPVIPAAAQQQFADAIRMLKAGQSDQASVVLQKLTVAYPAFMGALLNLGLIDQKADDHEAAIAWLKRALALDASSAVANTQLGVSYRHLGKFKEAEAAYQAAIAADTSYAMAHFNLGVLYDLYLQQPVQALQEYETYQSLLGTPDTKVASWIKELKVRVANSQTVKATAGVQP